MEPAERTIMMTEKASPRLNPKSMPAAIAARATRKPIFKIPPRKEKSFLVVKATKVRARKRARVANPAC